MTTQHSEMLPDDCSSCIRLFEALTSLDGPITTKDLGALVGLGERATYLHLAHLVLHSRVMSDRRTPVPDATVGSPADTPLEKIQTPLDWVLTVVCRDRMCRRMLVLCATHADAAWAAQLGVAQIASALGVHRDTIRVHRRHLTEDRLIRIERVSVRYESGHVQREDDRYVLLSGLLVMAQVHPVPLAGRTANEDWALSVLACARWWAPPATPKGRETTRQAVRLLVQVLAEYGWPSDEVRRRIEITPYDDVHDHLSLLRSLLRDCTVPYVSTARDHVSGTPAGRVQCARCSSPFPMSSRAVPGQVCADSEACAERAGGVPAHVALRHHRSW
ncbi:hypothetical protein ACFYN3_40640 [Streptomyces lavendulae]|uniref:hypothetical protein n=1 Tax=Streptomyces lavendulae TaxID=1914 RepID=UPI003695E70C